MIQNAVKIGIESANLGHSSLVARATDAQPSEEKVRLRIVDAAMTPRDYVNQYLEAHPELEGSAGHPDGVQYRDLAMLISGHYGMDFDHTTVYRAVKKRRGK